jgi:hypothetical protein
MELCLIAEPFRIYTQLIKIQVSNQLLPADRWGFFSLRSPSNRAQWFCMDDHDSIRDAQPMLDRPSETPGKPQKKAIAP